MLVAECHIVFSFNLNPSLSLSVAIYVSDAVVLTDRHLKDGTNTLNQTLLLWTRPGSACSIYIVIMFGRTPLWLMLATTCIHVT
jgi:hypothetical protein